MVVEEEEVVEEVVVKSWNRVALYNALQRHVVPCHPPSSQLDMSHVALLHHVHGGSAAGGGVLTFWAGPHRGVFAGGNSECATVNACDSSAKECGCRAGCVGGSDRGVVVGEEIRGRWKIVAGAAMRLLL